MGILKTLIQDIENFGKSLWHVIQTVFANVKAELIADATEILHAEAVAIQNARPGMTAKEFIALLIETGVPLLVKDAIHLEYTVISMIASTIAHDLSVSTNGGNAGNIGTNTA